MRPIQRSRGFTLIEAIIAMVITGVLSAIVAVFIARPIEGYVAAAKRADLTDSADLSLRRLGMEARSAIPNTVRVGTDYVEFIPSRGGGRYCGDTDSCTNRLTDFDPAGSTVHTVAFDILGPAPSVSATDQIIIFNTGQSGLNAYDNDNCGTVTNVTGSTVTYQDRSFPYASPNSRFHVAAATGPVRFNCTATQVQRISGATRFCGVTPTSGTSVLASADTVACSFTYNAISATRGLLSVRIALTNSGETISLMHQIHVDNQP